MKKFLVTAISIINKDIIDQGFCHNEHVKLELPVECGSNFTASALHSTDGNLILQCQHPLHGSLNCGVENVTGKYNVSTDIFEIDFIYNETVHGGQQYNISISCNDSSQAIQILLKPCRGFTVQSLQDQASALKRKAWANSTTSTYRTHMKTYLDFCDHISVPPLPATSKTLQLYATYLAKVKCFKFCSSQQYLNIIPHMHKLCNLPDLIPEDYQLKYLLMGIKLELGSAQFTVDSITPSHLLRMRSFIDFSSVEDLGFWCACLIAFYGLLRPGTIAITGPFETSQHVRRVELMPCSWGYLLCLRHTKTIQFRERELNVILPQVTWEMCPASAVQAYLHLTRGADLFGPLLLTGKGAVFTYSIFRRKLHSILVQAGIDDSNIKGHSFRRGGATWLSRIGVPVDQIQSIGYWSSDAVLRYIDPHFSNLLDTMVLFGKSLPNAK
ncbi:uncharacterized protein [Magallana gigas]|uniref:uncharacterized protein isoform X2 n=1 Tax=Magallana gigas TaxID=29159 RepID=UPI00333EEC69